MRVQNVTKDKKIMQSRFSNMTSTLYAETYNEYATLKAEQKKLGLHQGKRIVYDS